MLAAKPILDPGPKSVVLSSFSLAPIVLPNRKRVSFIVLKAPITRARPDFSLSVNGLKNLASLSVNGLKILAILSFRGLKISDSFALRPSITPAVNANNKPPIKPIAFEMNPLYFFSLNSSLFISFFGFSSANNSLLFSSSWSLLPIIKLTSFLISNAMNSREPITIPVFFAVAIPASACATCSILSFSYRLVA